MLFTKRSLRFFVSLFLFFVLFSFHLLAQDYRRWQMNADGSIQWNIANNSSHDDHLEMSGKFISCVFRYGVAADGSFHATRSIVWPMLRTIPNNTHASLTRQFKQDGFDLILINNKPVVNEKVLTVSFNGILKVKSKSATGYELTREFFPSTDKPGFCEIYTLKNTTGKSLSIEIPGASDLYTTDPAKGTAGSYTIKRLLNGSGYFTLASNDSLQFSVIYSGRARQQTVQKINSDEEKQKRFSLIQSFWHNLVLETPDTVLNKAFAFAKIRAAESIYETKGGPMHGPGGEAYYAAIWANDQAEYIGPFFPFLGYDYGNKASLNAYLQFARFMNNDYKPIPSSIIAEGTDIWNGAGDRGDAAMIAYGAARYALASGDAKQAKQVWPLIEWCLEYCKRKLNASGVVLSDADELEGRLPAGKANLCTSSLYYDALNSAVYLGGVLQLPKIQVALYKQQAVALKHSIEQYFGADVEGFKTYRYYEGNDVLRAWICIPLTMGIYDRKAGTIDALFSPRLWTKDGLASVAGETIFWDRSTLYALRGVLAAGETDKALQFLHYYSNRRLLGDHVPYPVEAYPEGNQRHLSAESGLYCRIFTEGLFGIRPTGLQQFRFTPRLPSSWSSMKLNHIRSFQHDFDISVERVNDKLSVVVKEGEKIWLKKIVQPGQEIVAEFK